MHHLSNQLLLLILDGHCWHYIRILYDSVSPYRNQCIGYQHNWFLDCWTNPVKNTMVPLSILLARNTSNASAVHTLNFFICRQSLLANYSLSLLGYYPAIQSMHRQSSNLLRFLCDYPCWQHNPAPLPLKPALQLLRRLSEHLLHLLFATPAGKGRPLYYFVSLHCNQHIGCQNT